MYRGSLLRTWAVACAFDDHHRAAEPLSDLRGGVGGLKGKKLLLAFIMRGRPVRKGGGI